MTCAACASRTCNHPDLIFAGTFGAQPPRSDGDGVAAEMIPVPHDERF